ncbi:adhesion G-protein coupled receptor G1 isoform X2 [Parambassis ranga]|uniref:Adhesion G-protein coupled receptor G1-like isoform X2 n=1 Tax=Parambassis ranga TaxID=210632 RepID=A0A6P7I2C3_9TELE|nr:adhesion G-protein coupled receptor G1-like isoform X2 [Parambassis ranga]XP_028256988.1 adhesion G-protein coupled receptor G1-like isoform X2 [Parambassis ranga]
MRVKVPSLALQRSIQGQPGDEVLLVAAVIDSSNFKLSRPRGRAVVSNLTILGNSVLAVMAGHSPVNNLSQPVRLFFANPEKVERGTCVFWLDSEIEPGTGRWSTAGCDTINNVTEFVCSCNHLSFFAVLVNPDLSVTKSDAVKLSYVNYVGSALSVIFTLISLIIYIHLHRRRPEKAIGLHMQLTGALFCLHLSYLLCNFWARQQKEDGWVCKMLGLFLHWSLLATFTWTALEGFHLYLLLVKVFNIYVRRYLLKLSSVGWGLPTLVASICGILGVYGKYSLPLKDANGETLPEEMCWMSSQFPHKELVIYITVVAFLCLVILCNTFMLGLVVFKLTTLREGSGGFERSGKKMSRERWTRLWKDCATVLGLSCVLGLPWALASTTYGQNHVTGIYIFTIFNALQGVFMFLWSVALTCKSRADKYSSVRDPSSQKMATTVVYSPGH